MKIDQVRHPVTLFLDCSANITVMTSLVLTILLGFVGLAIDASAWYSQKRSMQTAVDAAVMAAAYEMSRDSSTYGAAVAAAEDAAQRNGYADGLELKLVNGGTAFEAVLTDTAPQYLSHIFVPKPPSISALAAASVTRASICVLALDPAADKAVELTGSSSILAPGCRVQVNSEHPRALLVDGPDASLEALSVCVTGGVSGNNISPHPDVGCPPSPDPLESLEPPAFSDHGCTRSKKVTYDQTLSQGVFCDGLSIEGGTATLEPGIYVITNGNLNVSGTGAVVGDGVMIYLHGDKSQINVKGEGKIMLKGPKTGPYAGLIFFGDRNASTSTQHIFKHGAEKHYEGTVYLPRGEVVLKGTATATTTSPYAIYIARAFTMKSDGQILINQNYSDSDVPLPAGIDNERSVALVR